MASIAIIVLNWNRPDLTCQILDSLSKITHQKFTYKVIVVDNGSTDDSLNIITHALPKDSVLLNTRSNLGYVGGNNFGIKYALKHQFDYVLLINNDVIVKSDFLDQLVGFSLGHPQYSIFGPKIYFAANHEYHYLRYQKKDRGKVIWSAGGQMDWGNILGSNIGIDKVDKGQFDQINDSVDFISGCCLFTRSAILKKIGLLDPKYFMYLEDADFCQRAQKAGYHQVYVPQSIIWHLNAGSSNAGSLLHQYFITRNRLLFGFRYAKFRTKFALFRESIRKIIKPFSSWERRAVIDFYLGHLGKGSWQ